MIDFSKSFTWLFAEEQWFVKSFAPVLISLVPIFGGRAYNGYRQLVGRAFLSIYNCQSCRAGNIA